MRRAKADDYWRNLYEKDYDSTLDDFDFENVLGIGTGKLTLRGGITALCGGNGVGKTTLLQAVLNASMAKTSEASVFSNSKFLGSRLTFRGKFTKDEIEKISEFDADGICAVVSDDREINVTWIDPTEKSSELLHFLQ